MSYEAVDIKDRVAVGDDCFELEKLSDGRYRLVPAPDSITEVGTNVDRALLYPMSQELERLSESLPDATASDAGKALVVNGEGKYVLGVTAVNTDTDPGAWTSSSYPDGTEVNVYE